MIRLCLMGVGFAGACALLLAGCGEGAAPERGADRGNAPPAWVLASAPADAREVAAAKASAKEGDEVVVRGRIGGRAQPMSEESPVFTLIDLSIPHCGQIAGDSCPTPWDYCCETPESITANTATVQIVGSDGRPIGESPAAHGFEPLDEVIVVGTVGPRPDERVLTIRARGVHRVE